MRKKHSTITKPSFILKNAKSITCLAWWSLHYCSLFKFNLNKDWFARVVLIFPARLLMCALFLAGHRSQLSIHKSCWAINTTWGGYMDNVMSDADIIRAVRCLCIQQKFEEATRLAQTINDQYSRRTLLLICNSFRNSSASSKFSAA